MTLFFSLCAARLYMTSLALKLNWSQGLGRRMMIKVLGYMEFCRQPKTATLTSGCVLGFGGCR